MNGLASGTYGIGTAPYPCDAGTGRPQGWHYFQVGLSGIAACVLCGKTATK